MSQPKHTQVKFGVVSYHKMQNAHTKCNHETVEGTGHRSGGKTKPRVLTEHEEGELAWRIKKIAASGFPIMSLRDTAFLYTARRGIEGFSPKYKSAGQKWSKGFLKRHPTLTVKKVTQISRNHVKALQQSTINAWIKEYNEKVIEKYGITDPCRIWNVDKTSITSFILLNPIRQMPC